MTKDITPGFLRKLVGAIRFRAADDVEAEDIVQEAYARLAARARTTNIDNPEGFLMRTAQNLATSLHRRQAVRARAHQDHAVAELLSPKCAPQDEVFAARQRLAIVERAIAELPARAREVFVAHRIEELSYSEIAARLNISVSAVEKNMARAIAHLTIRLQDFGRHGPHQG